MEVICFRKHLYLEQVLVRARAFGKNSPTYTPAGRVRCRSPKLHDVPSHRSDAFRSSVHGEHGPVETALNEVDFQVHVIGAVPEILKLPRIFVQVVEFAQAVPVIDHEFVSPVAIHRGILGEIEPSDKANKLARKVWASRGYAGE